MEIVWHGHYVKYLELARSALLAKFDYDYPQMRESGYRLADRRHAAEVCAPGDLRPGAQGAREIVEWENRLRIDYLIRDARPAASVNQATTIQVAVDLATREMCFVCPPVLWERLGVAP